MKGLSNDEVGAVLATFDQRHREYLALCIDEHSSLSHHGRSVIGGLVTRSRHVRTWIESLPDNSDALQLPSPAVVICGAPRSGTSALQEGLRNVGFATTTASLCWAGIERLRGEPDRAQRQVNAETIRRQVFTPKLNTVRSISADSVEECLMLQRDLLFGGFLDLLIAGRLTTDGPARYSALDLRLYWTYLSAVVASSTKGWWDRPIVIKHPGYMFSLPEVQAVWPKALFVYLHRSQGRRPSIHRILEGSRAGLVKNLSGLEGDVASLENSIREVERTDLADVLWIETETLRREMGRTLTSIHSNL